MKIAFIGQKGIPGLSGGVEKHVEKLAVCLRGLGHEVTVYTRPWYTSTLKRSYRGVRLISLPSLHTKHWDALSHTLLATLHALFQDYDVIHYQSIGPSVLSFIPRIFKPQVRVVATFHSRDYFHKKWGAVARLCLKAAEFFTCHIPERTIAVSEHLASYARGFYHCDAIAIPNGASVTPGRDLAVLKRYGLRPGQYCLSVSRLLRHKGIHYLIKAFMELEDTNKVPNNYKLVIVGTHANTEEYEEYLKVMAMDRSNIIFTGELTGEPLMTLFAHAGIFVQPSEDEGLSVALLEAMAFGLPALVSDIPANIELVRGGAGASFISKNTESLKQELAYYINRPEEAGKLGATAKERIEAHYSWEAIAAKTVEVYEEVMKEHEAQYHIESHSHHVV